MLAGAFEHSARVVTQVEGLAELRVRARAVVALVVVLEDDLPVGPDVVAHDVSDLAAGDVESLELGFGRLEDAVERFGSSSRRD